MPIMYKVCDYHNQNYISRSLVSHTSGKIQILPLILAIWKMLLKQLMSLIMSKLFPNLEWLKYYLDLTWQLCR